MNNNVVSLIVFCNKATEAVHDCGLGKLLPSATKLGRLCFYTCLSVHGGICLSTCWDSTPSPRRRHPPWKQAPPQEQTPPRACTPCREQAPPKSRHHPPRAAPHPVDGCCCGQYASYWNAFLLACHFVSAEKEEPINLVTEGAFSIEISLFRVIGWVENTTDINW